MCMVEWADDWDVYEDYMVAAARKEHRCSECRRTIAVGESYRRAKGIIMGRAQSYATCRHCLAAIEWLNKACSGYLFTAVLEDLDEHWRESEEYRSPMLRLLIDGVRTGWSAGVDPIPDVQAIRASVPAA